MLFNRTNPMMATLLLVVAFLCLISPTQVVHGFSSTLSSHHQKTILNHHDHYLNLSKDRRRFRLSSSTTSVNAPGSELPSLYKEQERLLVERGVVESELMLNTGTPIEQSTIKGAGTQAKGFAASSGMKSSDIKASAKHFGKELRKFGVVRIDNVLTDDIADDLKNYVSDLRKQSDELVRSGEVKPLARFANVLLKENRCDLTIPLEDDIIVVDALLHVLQKSPVGKMMSSMLGKDPSLYELSCLISDNGSQRQVVHPDTPCTSDDGEADMYTCFIALQDIKKDMGPTTWIPSTHTTTAHTLFRDDQLDRATGESPKDKLLRTSPSVLGLLPKGSCGIFDSRLLHCGGANESGISRSLFYFTFKNSEIGYPGNPASIRPELLSKYTMKTLEAELKKLKKKK